MALSSDLISAFVKVTNDKTEVKQESTVYGTIVEYEGSKYVKLDGSDLLTPISSTTDAEPDERVTVMIKNHSATVTGNLSSPAARTESVQQIGNQISEVEILVADKVSTKEFDAQNGRIDNLVSDNVLIREQLTATNADIDNLEADTVKINEELTAQKATITELDASKLTAKDADLKYATIANLDAANAEIHNLEADYGEFKQLTTDQLVAVDADIVRLDAAKLTAADADLKYASIANLDVAVADITYLEGDLGNFKTLTADKLAANDASIADLEAKKLTATEAELKYANIDFTNIGKAAMEYLYANSGLIRDVVIDNGTITGNLVGVTISGDLIEGNTIVAEKLVIKGEDGLYYQLNTDGVTTETEQTDYNSLNGSIIKANSITATKIDVSDLVAFDATIGGFKITENSIYSGTKESATNTTRGIYLDNDGQIAFGNAESFIKFYKDTDGTYKLGISADSITFGADKTPIEDIADNIRIGGRNLLKGTQNDVWQEIPADGTAVLYSVRSYTELAALGVTAGDTLCYSVGLKTDVAMKLRMILTTNTSDSRVVDAKGEYFSGEGRAWVSAVVPATAQYVRMYISSEGSGVEDAFWKGEKLEKGNKPTDWTPAPEDVEGDIADLNVRVTASEASMELLQDEISLKVSQTEYYGVKTAEGTILQKDGLLKDQGIIVESTFGPVQSGSGDPYPAGCGKNLLNGVGVGTTFGNVTATRVDISKYKLTGTAANNAVYQFTNPFTLPAGTYTLSATFDNTSLITDTTKIIGQIIANGAIIAAASRSPASFTVDTDTEVYVRIHVHSGVVYNGVTVGFQLEKGSAATAWQPYSNIRPIGGRTSAKLTRAGKNLCSPAQTTSTHGAVEISTIGDGCYTYNGTATGNAVKPIASMKIPAGTYTLSHTVISGSTTNADKAVAQFNLVSDNSIPAQTYANNSKATWTFAEDTEINIRLYVGAGKTYTNWKIAVQLEKGSTATAYEPYHADTFNTDFGQTVYGGMLDWNTGVLTVDRVMIAMSGSETPKNISVLGDFVRFTLPVSPAGVEYVINTTDGACSHVPYKMHWSEQSAHAYVNANSLAMILPKSLTGTTDSAIAAYLAAQYTAGTPVQIAYRLAAPTTIQLTPQQILALEGLNTVYTDLDSNYAEFGHDSLSGLGAASDHDLKNLTSRVTTAESKIEQKADSIALSVLEIEVDGIAIGGRNLLLDSAAHTMTADSSGIYYGADQTLYLSPDVDLQSLINQELTLSAWIHSPGEWVNPGTSELNRWDLYTTVRWTDSTGTNAEVKSTWPCYINGVGVQGQRRCSTAAITPPSGYDTISEMFVYVSSILRPADGNSAVWQMREIKLEKGNRATDWSPAPEDVDASIAANEAALTVFSDEISTRVTTVHSGLESAISQLSESISTLVKGQNGESLMTQTENGWEFNIGNIQNSLSAALSNIDTLNLDVNDLDSLVNALNKSVDDLGVYTDYIKFGTDNGKPCITLGETDSAFKVLITNTDIRFMEGSEVPASISNQSLNIGKAVIEDELKQGGFVWMARDNGNYGILWRGE